MRSRSADSGTRQWSLRFRPNVAMFPCFRGRISGVLLLLLKRRNASGMGFWRRRRAAAACVVYLSVFILTATANQNELLFLSFPASRIDIAGKKMGPVKLVS